MRAIYVRDLNASLHTLHSLYAADRILIFIVFIISQSIEYPFHRKIEQSKQELW